MIVVFCIVSDYATTRIYSYLLTLSLPDALPIYIGVDDTGVRDMEFALAGPCQDWNRSCDRRGNVTPAEYCRVRKPVDEIDNQQAKPAAQPQCIAKALALVNFHV